MFVFFDDTAGVEVRKRALGGHSLLSLILLSVDLRGSDSCFISRSSGRALSSTWKLYYSTEDKSIHRTNFSSYVVFATLSNSPSKLIKGNVSSTIMILLGMSFKFITSKLTW